MRFGYPQYLVVATLMTLLFHDVAAQSDTAQSPAKAPTALAEAPVPARTDTQDLIDTVRYEREVLERQAERQSDALLAIAQLVAWVFSGILASVVGLFVWMFGSTRRELRESLQEFAREQLKQLIEAEADEFRRHVARVEAEIESLRAKRRPVTWIVRDERDANNELIALLQARNVDVSTVLPIEGQNFEIGSPELVVLTYLPTAIGSRRLRELIELLRDRAPQVPVVVYTFNPEQRNNRLVEADEEILDEYRWYVPANFPLQLVTHVNSLLFGSRMERLV